MASVSPSSPTPSGSRATPPSPGASTANRLQLYRQTTPHAGFHILRRWGERLLGRCHVFTSNVDGHFQKAGFPHVTEVHGSIHHLQCAADCPGIWPADGDTVTVDPDTFRAHPPFPLCRTCGGLARPNILMFGDSAWRSYQSERQQQVLNAWIKNVRGSRLIILECGAGTAVPTVRMYSEYIADRYRATLIRLNLREPEVPPTHIGLAAGALEGLRTLDAALGSET